MFEKELSFQNNLTFKGDGYQLYLHVCTGSSTNCYMNTIEIMPHYVIIPFMVISHDPSYEQGVISHAILAT